MAFLFTSFCKFLVFFCLHLLTVHSVEFEVGNDKGWVVPSSKNEQIYNQWASKKRFQVNDTVRFKYRKDSVLVVTDTEYEECHSTHPLFFSNNGDTIFKLDHPASLIYFISGLAEHCQRGQKMIIKVLEPEDVSPPTSQNSSANTSDHSGGGAVGMASIPSAILMQFITVCLGFLLV